MVTSHEQVTRLHEPCSFIILFKKAEYILSQIPESFMKSVFVLYLAVELQGFDDNFVNQVFEDLAKLFPKSSYLLSQRALYYYSQRRKCTE